MSLRFSPTLMREPDFESLNDQGRGTKWSVGHGGGLEVWGGGLWSAAEGRPLAPWTAEETDGVGGQTASGAWAGTAHDVIATKGKRSRPKARQKRCPWRSG